MVNLINLTFKFKIYKNKQFYKFSKNYLKNTTFYNYLEY